jgi:hypothetical protein
MLLGRSSLKLEGSRTLAKSFFAIPAHLLVLPATLFFGEHVFMRYCVKLSSHAGRVLAWLRLNPMKERPE